MATGCDMTESDVTGSEVTGSDLIRPNLGCLELSRYTTFIFGFVGPYAYPMKNYRRTAKIFAT
jgi:hypothetical protein